MSSPTKRAKRKKNGDGTESLFFVFLPADSERETHTEHERKRGRCRDEETKKKKKKKEAAGSREKRRATLRCSAERVCGRRCNCAYGENQIRNYLPGQVTPRFLPMTLSSPNVISVYAGDEDE